MLTSLKVYYPKARSVGGTLPMMHLTGFPKGKLWRLNRRKKNTHWKKICLFRYGIKSLKYVFLCNSLSCWQRIKRFDNACKYGCTQRDYVFNGSWSHGNLFQHEITVFVVWHRLQIIPNLRVFNRRQTVMPLTEFFTWCE